MSIIPELHKERAINMINQKSFKAINNLKEAQTLPKITSKIDVFHDIEFGELSHFSD